MISLQEGIVPEIRVRSDYAVIAITKHGVELARNLLRSFGGVDVYYMSKFARGDEDVVSAGSAEGLMSASADGAGPRVPAWLERRHRPGRTPQTRRYPRRISHPPVRPGPRQSMRLLPARQAALTGASNCSKAASGCCFPRYFPRTKGLSASSRSEP